ncbi:hypothetical protein G4O51_05930 [Candidatus Bathyarchaeota archaeon A05DMB-2]|nr:hypothetical protein [Candidatus Bathyarchaeota archaeon A05DMB-2]
MSKAPMQQARSGLGVAAVNGKIYAIGGSTQSGFAPGVHGSVVYGNINIGSFVGTNEEYDPATDTWTFRKPMPTPRIAFAIAVYRNKIYCIGGRSIAGSTSGGYTGVNEVYDPTTDTWETKAPMLTARGWLTAAVVNGKIYLIGGYPNGTLNEVYDPVTDLWTTKASIPTSIATIRGWISTAADGKIYVIGGYYGSGKLNQIYDPETDRWSQGAPPPSLSGIITSGVTTGFLAPKKIYVIGPQVYGEPSNGVYDPVNNSWTFGADVPTRRYNFDVAVVNDKLYAIGGHTYDVGSGYFEPTALNEMYTPLGYGTVPPVVAVVSPESTTYNSTSVSLVFTVNKPVVWMGYSLDGWDNITITGNTTLS